MKQNPRSIAIMGAGKIGGAIAKMLSSSGDYHVTVLDVSEDALASFRNIPFVSVRHLASPDTASLSGELTSFDAVVSACAFDLSVPIARAALDAGISYFDLTEDVAATAAIREMAAGARDGQIFMPQCGLAPGFVGILAADMVKRFESVESVRMRVGALPLYPDNRFKYNLTWSTEGLINEYCNPCEAIEKGRPVKLQPLEGLEHLMVEGVEYEAFNTSGGLGTLCETLRDRVDELNYKTLRYPGHRDLMLLLTKDLGLGAPRKQRLMKMLLEESIPFTAQDTVVISVTVKGIQEGRLTQISETRRILHAELRGEHWTAIQLATASGICAVIDLYYEGELPQKGFVKQEQVALPVFLQNRFGFQFNRADHNVN